MTIEVSFWKPYSIQHAAGVAPANKRLSPDMAGTNKRFEILDLYFTTDASTTDSTAARIGFGASATPTPSATNPVVGIVLDHPGAAPGLPIAGIPGTGAANENLYLTGEDPVGGSITVTFLGRVV